MGMSAKSETIAYCAWVASKERGWDWTLSECAENIGVSVSSLRKIAHSKGWSNRFRVAEKNNYEKAKSLKDVQNGR